MHHHLVETFQLNVNYAKLTLTIMTGYGPFDDCLQNPIFIFIFIFATACRLTNGGDCV